MATIKYLVQSTSDNANIYIRFSINRKTILKRKTGFTISQNDWNNKKGSPIIKTNETKNIKNKLDRLRLNIQSAYNNDIENGLLIDGEWLQTKIDLFNNKVEVKELDVVTNYINKYIADAPNKKNQKNTLGLGERRIKGLITFRNLFIQFENETNNQKKYLIREININFNDKFINWLIQKKYSINYIGKNIDNLKTICHNAEKNGIQISPQLKAIKSFSENKEPENIIYLTELEQQKISETEFKQKSLNNAKNWLLLGCLIGQRAGDLLAITKSDIKIYNGKKIIELKQEKTGKLVAIPLIPDALKIIEFEMPYKISYTKFNLYIKQICQKAEINEIIMGRAKTEAYGPTRIIKAPKYKLISTHVCRRSFATNFYGKIPTSILRNITGHSSEKMFLKYIAKTTHESALQMLTYFE